MTDTHHAFHDHDHSACAEDALAEAERLCAEAGARLTPVRRAALVILLSEHKAMGAYEVLEKLAQNGFGSQPPVAYRALDFLVEQGLAHRIRRLNAFAACTHPGDTHAPVFLICTSCSQVAEVPGDDTRAALDAEAAHIGFSVERASLEAVGQCPACTDASA